ncbi:MAG: 4Fe-4S dicluster domain-containing protein [Syntrophomonas sp.]|nr:4Fe-4S dicluster domain-containing protein [Syntrophomonas sp.]
MSREYDRDWDPDLYKKIDKYNSVKNLEQCLQCGKCTGNCPVAAITPSYNPRAIINDILAGSTARILDSDEIWRCMKCGTCYRGCPVDISFTSLILELRFAALESGHGQKYVVPANKFVFRSMEYGINFVPGKRGMERVMKLRSDMGVEPFPKVTPEAIEQFKAIFEQTQTLRYMEKLKTDTEKPLRLSYAEGRIVNE